MSHITRTRRWRTRVISCHVCIRHVTHMNASLVDKEEHGHMKPLWKVYVTWGLSLCVTWRDSYVWHDALVCVTWQMWRIHVCDMIYETWLIHMGDMTAFICVTWHIHTCEMIHVTWLIHMGLGWCTGRWRARVNYIYLSHVTHINESYHRYGQVNLVTRMNTYEHVWMGHVVHLKIQGGVES